MLSVDAAQKAVFPCSPRGLGEDARMGTWRAPRESPDGGAAVGAGLG